MKARRALALACRSRASLPNSMAAASRSALQNSAACGVAAFTPGRPELSSSRRVRPALRRCGHGGPHLQQRAPQMGLDGVGGNAEPDREVMAAAIPQIGQHDQAPPVLG